jgi:hypothetical protein
VTPEKRLELVRRIVALVRWRIEQNGGRYDGRDAPNLQSVTDITCVEDRYLVGVEEQIAQLERQAGSTPEGA